MVAPQPIQPIRRLATETQQQFLQRVAGKEQVIPTEITPQFVQETLEDARARRTSEVQALIDAEKAELNEAVARLKAKQDMFREQGDSSAVRDLQNKINDQQLTNDIIFGQFAAIGSKVQSGNFDPGALFTFAIEGAQGRLGQIAETKRARVEQAQIQEQQVTQAKQEGLTAIFREGKLVGFEDEVTRMSVGVEQAVGVIGAERLRRAGFEVTETRVMFEGPEQITFGQPEEFARNYNRAIGGGSGTFTIAIPIGREGGKIRVQDFTFKFDERGRLIKTTPKTSGLISEKTFLAADKRRRDRLPEFTFGDTRSVSDVEESFIRQIITQPPKTLKEVFEGDLGVLRRGTELAKFVAFRPFSIFAEQVGGEGAELAEEVIVGRVGDITGETLRGVSLLIPETPAEFAVIGGAIRVAKTGVAAGRIVGGVFTGISFPTAIDPDLPLSERIAGGIVAVGGGAAFLRGKLKLKLPTRRPTETIRDILFFEEFAKKGTPLESTFARDVVTGVEGRPIFEFDIVPEKPLEISLKRLSEREAISKSLEESPIGRRLKFEELVKETIEFEIALEEAGLARPIVRPKLTETQKLALERVAEKKRIEEALKESPIGRRLQLEQRIKEELEFDLELEKIGIEVGVRKKPAKIQELVLERLAEQKRIEKSLRESPVGKELSLEAELKEILALDSALKETGLFREPIPKVKPSELQKLSAKQIKEIRALERARKDFLEKAKAEKKIFDIADEIIKQPRFEALRRVQEQRPKPKGEDLLKFELAKPKPQEDIQKLTLKRIKAIEDLRIVKPTKPKKIKRVRIVRDLSKEIEDLPSEQIKEVRTKGRQQLVQIQKQIEKPIVRVRIKELLEVEKQIQKQASKQAELDPLRQLTKQTSKQRSKFFPLIRFDQREGVAQPEMIMEKELTKIQQREVQREKITQFQRQFFLQDILQKQSQRERQIERGILRTRLGEPLLEEPTRRRIRGVPRRPIKKRKTPTQKFQEDFVLFEGAVSKILERKGKKIRRTDILKEINLRAKQPFGIRRRPIIVNLKPKKKKKKITNRITRRKK